MTETYEAFRARMQAEDPDPDRCAHAMPLAGRCIRCEDETGGDESRTCYASRTIGAKADPYDLWCFLDTDHDGDHRGMNPVDPEAEDLLWSSLTSPIVIADDPTLRRDA